MNWFCVRTWHSVWYDYVCHPTQVTTSSPDTGGDIIYYDVCRHRWWHHLLRHVNLVILTEWKKQRQNRSFLYLSCFWQRLNCCSVIRWYNLFRFAFNPYNNYITNNVVSLIINVRMYLCQYAICNMQYAIRNARKYSRVRSEADACWVTILISVC